METFEENARQRAQTRNEITDLESKIQKFQKTNEELAREVARLRSELAALKGELSEANTENLRLLLRGRPRK